MKKFLVIIILLILILLGVFICFKNNEKNNADINLINSDNVAQIDEKTNDENVVIIENNKIKNEDLIDEFIEKTEHSNSANSEKLALEIIKDDTKIKVLYTPGELSKNNENSEKQTTTIQDIDDNLVEAKKKIYGFYSLIIDDELEGDYPLDSHTIRRSISDNNVVLYFDALLIEYITIPTICQYSLDSSNYSKKFDLLYSQRKDMDIRTVYDTGEYKVKTFGRRYYNYN